MNELLALCQKKLDALERALILETHADEKFRLQELFDECKAHCEKLAGISFNPPDLTRLPHPSTNQFIGRGAELKQLEQAFNNRQQTGIVGLIAGGGVGKSALTYQWIRSLKEAGFGGILRVFAWSFYSQGSHQKTFTSSQEFFTKALPFFGFVGELPNDDIEKARAFVKCFASQPALLILDGFEPLQHAADSLGGDIADAGIKKFLLLLELHRHPQSFVLISSRQPIVELQGRADYLDISLETLSVADGAELLRALNVRGTAQDIEAASENLRGHALSLVLLANLLAQYHKGDIRYVQELPALESDKKCGGQAKRVLSYYDQLLSENERRFMHCLGLFDRPMHWKEKQKLLENAEYFQSLQEDWDSVQENLERKGLLLNSNSIEISETSKWTQWDTHPLIRQFFAQQFEQQHQQAFRQAHKVLFEYFQSVPEKDQPDTLEELEPLYRAVVHGCLAGEYETALKDVHWIRICRKEEYYNHNKLGAYSQELMVLRGFFSENWEASKQITNVAVISLLSDISFCLLSLGRIPESIDLQKRYITAALNAYKLDYAISAVVTLIDSLIFLGRLRYANAVVDNYIIHMENVTNYHKSEFCSRIAFLYFYQGDMEGSLKLFKKSEQLQKNHDHPYLCSLANFRYCDLLLHLAKNKKAGYTVLRRVKYISDFHTPDYEWSTAITKLALARCYSFLKQDDKLERYFSEAILHMGKSKQVSFLPECYLARANFYLTQNELENAKADIDTANETIKRCGMKLYAVDAALASARYHLALNDKATAKQFCEQAEMLIEETSYHLRDNALKELQQQAN
jgi:hypothetical protein